jgi:hypothetical protein
MYPAHSVCRRMQRHTECAGYIVGPETLLSLLLALLINGHEQVLHVRVFFLGRQGRIQ